MNNKTRKTLKRLLYSVPIVAALSFLPLKDANGQMTKINHPTKREWNGKSRIERPNAFYLGVQVGHLPIQGYTVGYSRKVTPKLEPYILLSKGTYESPFNFFGSEFDSHVNYINISLGTIINLKKDNLGSNAFVCFGPSYNFLNKKNYVPETIDEKAFRKLSVEGGAGMKFEGRVGVGFLFNSNIECKLFGKFSFN
ncbi:MAG: hypothetical protein ABIE36_03745 [Candidatus Diapherotrites archaeon]